MTTAGKAVWTLDSVPAIDAIITYDGMVVGAGGAVPQLPVVPPLTLLNNRVGIMGDSRALSSIVETNGQNVASLAGFLPWVLAKAPQVLVPASAVNAVGGDTTAPYQTNPGMTYRMVNAYNGKPALLDTGVGLVVLLAGSADRNFTLAQTIAAYQTMLQQCLDRKVMVALCNELPRDIFTGAELTLHLQRVAWLSDPARKAEWPNLAVQIDTFNPLLKAGTQCQFLAGASDDGTHPNPVGHKVLGETIGAALEAVYRAAGFISTAAPYTNGEAAFDAANNPYGCLNSNPSLTGTGGTKPGTGTVTGAIPAGWTLNHSVAGVTVDSASYVDADGYTRSVLHVTGSTTATGTQTVRLTTPVPVAGLVNGDRLRTAGRLKVRSAPAGLASAMLDCAVSGTDTSGTFRSSKGGTFGPAFSSYPTFSYDYVLQTLDAQVPNDYQAWTGRSANAEVTLSFAGDGTALDFYVEIGRVAARRYPLAASGALSLGGSPPNITNQQPLNFTPLIQGGTPPYTRTATVPTGILFNAGTGTFSASNLTAGSYQFTESVTDSSQPPVTVTKTFTQLVTVPLTLSGPAARSATVGQAFSWQAAAAGGVGPYDYSASGKPAGWTFSNTGLLAVTAGASTTAGDFTLTVTATDQAGGSISTTFGFSVATAAPAPTPTPTPTTSNWQSQDGADWQDQAGASWALQE